MQKKCFGCANFSEYYLKQTSRFAKSGCGNCKIKKQRVGRRGTCAAFEEKPAPRNLDCAAVLCELEEILTALNGVKLILGERTKE